MNPNHIIQLMFCLLFTVVLLAGVYMLANFNRLFGPDPTMPSENSSSRAYTKVQAAVIWVHALVLTGSFALLLH